MPADLFHPPTSGGGLSTEWVYDRVDAWTYIPLYPYVPTATAPISSVATAAATGVNPTETSYALFGHVVPLLVLGRGRVGGDIISGPRIDGGNAYGINSFGVQADPTRILTLIEIAFDSEVVWEGTCVGNATAAVTPASSGFRSEPFTVRFYTGSLDQPADPLETTPYGANAVGYIGQVLLAIDGLPLANTKFKKYPYISARFVDQDGEAINFGEAFTRLALSPYVGLTADQFETVDITDGVPDGGFIITQDTEFLGLIQQYGRFYRNWDILQTDKLRIVDRGSDTAPDIVLDKSSLTGKVTISRAEPDSIPRELILSTIDPDADYTIVPSKASFPRDAVAVSTSVKTETQYLPVIMDSSTRQSIVTFTKYSEEIARKRISCTAMIKGLEIEPGDLVGFEGLADGISDETFTVKETTTGANLSVEIVAESFMDCQIPIGDPDWDNVVLLMGYEGTDGSTGSPGFLDESPRLQGVAGGTSVIDTAQFKFGQSSAIDPRLLYGPNADWCLSSANSDQFTVECFVRFSALNFVNVSVLVGANFAGTQWFLGEDGTTLEFAYRPLSGGALVAVGASTAITTGVWYHVAADKDATGKIRVYLDGAMIASATPADSAFDPAGNELQIGCFGLFSTNTLSGWLDELRITKGVARYASDGGFTVPTAAYPREGV